MKTNMENKEDFDDLPPEMFEGIGIESYEEFLASLGDPSNGWLDKLESYYYDEVLLGERILMLEEFRYPDVNGVEKYWVNIQFFDPQGDYDQCFDGNVKDVERWWESRERKKKIEKIMSKL